MTEELLREAAEGTPQFDEILRALERRGGFDLERVEPTVREIVKQVRSGGDQAVIEAITRLEKRQVERLFSTEYGGRAALEGLAPALNAALHEAALRIERFHQRQARELQTFEYEEDGVHLGTRVRPLRIVGVYVPGGKARYPSSVLMSAIVARVAGVETIVVATPNPPPEVRAACHLAGVDALLDAGGAQAIAALAYGTESVPRVDKIVGPGNLYVTAAKRLVFGDVDIDGIAGPSEILVIADDSADPVIVAADLLSQAEHDEAAYALLLTSSPALVSAVRGELSRQLASLPRRDVATASLRQNGTALVVQDRSGLSTLASRIAAEHVSVQTRDPRELAGQISAAGAIFIGAMTPEAAGDYVAGPSHVLPTGGAARFGAPLGVYDFVARTSLIEYQAAALERARGPIEVLAEAEGLSAHARAVSMRLERLKSLKSKD